LAGGRTDRSKGDAIPEKAGSGLGIASSQGQGSTPCHCFYFLAPPLWNHPELANGSTWGHLPNKFGRLLPYDLLFLKTLSSGLCLQKLYKFRCGRTRICFSLWYLSTSKPSFFISEAAKLPAHIKPNMFKQSFFRLALAVLWALSASSLPLATSDIDPTTISKSAQIDGLPFTPFVLRSDHSLNSRESGLPPDVSSLTSDNNFKRDTEDLEPEVNTGLPGPDTSSPCRLKRKM